MKVLILVISSLINIQANIVIAKNECTNFDKLFNDYIDNKIASHILCGKDKSYQKCLKICNVKTDEDRKKIDSLENQFGLCRALYQKCCPDEFKKEGYDCDTSYNKSDRSRGRCCKITRPGIREGVVLDLGDGYAKGPKLVDVNRNRILYGYCLSGDAIHPIPFDKKAVTEFRSAAQTFRECNNDDISPKYPLLKPISCKQSTKLIDLNKNQNCFKIEDDGKLTVNRKTTDLVYYTDNETTVEIKCKDPKRYQATSVYEFK